MKSRVSALTQELSAYISGALKKRLPPEVEEKAKHLVLDTLAAMISGSRLPPGEKAISYVRRLGGPREASVVGADFMTSAVNAALANGMLAHADETDDSHAPSHTHPGCSIVPAALAMCDVHARSGNAMLRAVALGYDVCCRLTMSLDATPAWQKGLSTHGFGGTFGSAAAAGALAGLKAREIPWLLSYAGQQCGGMSCLVRDAEHIEKAFDLGGWPAKNGVTAARMVAHGFTGVDDIFSGERNFFHAHAINAKPGELTRELGSRFEILGTNIKKWCVGSPIQAALDSLAALMQAHGIQGGDAGKVIVRVDERGARIVDNRPMPDINLQHMLALMLVDGKVTFDASHDVSRMTDPQIVAMKKRIQLVPSPELNDARPRRQGIVEVTTRDGRTLTHRTYAVKGTADNPMTRVEVEEKALDLLASVVGARRARTLVETVWKLDTVADMRKLRPLLRVTRP